VYRNDLTLGYGRNPFTLDIRAQELPVGFQFAKKLDDYDETKDPHQHVQNFERIVTFQGIHKPLACRAFSLTLIEAAGRWFNELPPNSIGSWQIFKDKFLRHFTSNKRQFKSEYHLKSIT
jgi:hypothetical protein